jgi:hypothetical protein
MSRLVAINEKGMRIGESHGRAKLTDHDVDLILDLLDARAALIATYGNHTNLKGGEIRKALADTHLSHRRIAEKFEVSKWLIRRIEAGECRLQTAVRWKRVADSAQTITASL